MKLNGLFLKGGLTFMMLLMLSQFSNAQVYIEGFGGWLWTAKIPGYRQDLKVDDLGNYGARIGFEIDGMKSVEFEWNQTNTTVHYYDWDVGGQDKIDITMNYYMLGFVHNVSEEQVQPYGLFNLGILNLSSAEPGISSFNMFTVGLGGGLKYHFTDNIGIRLQARLLVPMQFAGVGFGCGIGTGGSGCGGGVSTYSSILQGDFTGALVIKFGG